MNIKQIISDFCLTLKMGFTLMSDFWLTLRMGFTKIIKGLIWFCMTFLIASMPVVGVWFWKEMFGEKLITFKDFILQGDIFAISVVLISSLLWDYVFFEDKTKANFWVNLIFYGVPLVIIHFNVVGYIFCQVGKPQQQSELIILVQIWMLAITSIYAILIKWNALEQTHA